MSRRQLREAVFLTLFQTAFSPKETEPDNIVEEIIQANIEEFELIAAPADAAYISETVKAVLAYSDKSDEIINRYSKTRKVGRIAKVNAAVMRLALYEMDCIDDDKVPPKVAM
ncbi:MAG: hypothetical protein FWF82_04525, partial [Oscillospiraceae bacterium]|nr:hypothetical protein [Oscillospiraceae bacterium]